MRRRTALITALCALVALVGVGVTAAIVWGAATHPDAKPTVSASPSPSPTATAVALAQVAAVEGAVADW